MRQANTMFLARAMATSAIALTAALAAPAAAAQESTAAEAQADIPAGALGPALGLYAAATGYQLLYPSSLVEGKTTSGLSGRYPVQEGLARLLSGTGLTFRVMDGRTIQIIASASSGNVDADGDRVLGAVRIEGEQGSPYFGGAGKMAGVNGINGSRDITATEGTGSFTSGALTIGSKVPQAMKDVPQSISVLTSERLEQQNVTDFTTAMRQLPGVLLVQGDARGANFDNTFYSRGFAITSIQVDGGAPLATSFSVAGYVPGTGFSPQIDMSIYDHVELLRGAAGLFNGYGDPSGTVNLVRKKPLDHSQFTLEAQAGSWSNYRVVADATSPLALDGRLRGRLVMTYQDQRYFYDTAKLNKTLIYGIAEFDATPTTLVSVGINYTKQDNVPFFFGLPRYVNGDDIGLPRSTCLCFDWNRQNFDTREMFGTVEQKIGSEWDFKLNITQNRQTSTAKYGFVSGTVNPSNGKGMRMYGYYNDYANRQFSAEATLAGAFTLLGQRQEVVIGASRTDFDGGGQTAHLSTISGTPDHPYQPYPGGPVYCNAATPPCPVGSIRLSTPPVDVLNFDAGDPRYTEPPNSLPYQRNPLLDQAQWGAYLNLRLTAFNRLHLTTGLRWSHYKVGYSNEYLCTFTTGDCAGLEIGDAYSLTKFSFGDDDISWPPPINLSFDVTKSLSVYAGYTDIYLSQANNLTADLQPIDPITGSNWEAGAKWAARGGRLNLSLAAYRIQKKGFGQQVFESSYVENGQTYLVLSDGVVRPLHPDPYHTCCFVINPNQTYESRGIDAEVTGELLPGLQVSANYTYNDQKLKGSDFGSYQGEAFLTISPKHLYKIWMSYSFREAGYNNFLRGLTVSAGVNGQSSGYNSGATCVNLDEAVPPDAITGAQPCKSYAAPDYVTYDFVVPSQALLSGRLDYRFSDNWSLAINLENILDKKYYQTTGSVRSGNWYGAPRSVTISASAKF